MVDTDIWHLYRAFRPNNYFPSDFLYFQLQKEITYICRDSSIHELGKDMTSVTCCSSSMSLVCYLLSCVQVSSFTKQIICDALDSGDVFSRIQLNKRLHWLALMSWSVGISLHFELKILYRADPFLEKSIPLSNSRFLYLYYIHWDLSVVYKATWLSATHLLYDRRSASSTNPTPWNQICTHSMYHASLQ